MRKKYEGRKFIKRIVSQLLVIALLITSCNLNNLGVVFAENEEEKTYMLLENYTFDAEFELDASALDIDEIDEDKKVIKDNAIVQYGVELDENGNYITDTLPITIDLDSKKAKITGIKVYIDQATDSMLNGGTGEYTVDNSFYTIKIPATVSEKEYNLDFNGGITVTKDANDLEWSAEGKDKIKITKRAVKKYTFEFTFYADEEVDTLPEAFKNRIKFAYEEDGEHYIKPEDSNIKRIGGSKFRIVFKNIPEQGQSKRLYIPVLNNNVMYFGNNIAEVEETYDGCYSLGESKFDDVTGGITYIEQTSMTGTLVWMDSNNESDVRPDVDIIKSLIKVYRTNSDEEARALAEPLDESEYNINIQENPNEENKWNINITNLQIYDLDGKALAYYFTVNDGNYINATDTNHLYKPQYDNGKNSVSTDKAYSGATIYLPIYVRANSGVSFKTFSVNVDWHDDAHNGNEDGAARKSEIADGAVKLYLWRYAGSDNTKGAPVYDDNGNQYSYTLIESDTGRDSVPITLETFNSEYATNLSVFPHYNENGHRYTYYITAVNTKTGYTINYSDENGSECQFAESGQKVNLTRIGVKNITARVSWYAIGEDDYMNTSAEVELQRKLCDASDDTWKPVDTKNVPAASEAAVSTKVVFPTISMYNDKGQSYQFRVVEKGGCKTDDPNKKYTVSDNKFEYCDHSYEVSTKEEENTYIIENKIVGTTDFNLLVRYRKTDSPADLEQVVRSVCNSNGMVQYTINRDGSKFATVIIENGKYSVKFEDISLQKQTGNISFISENEEAYVLKFDAFKLPKYDDAGRKYTYNVSENSKDHEGLTDSYTRITYGSDTSSNSAYIDHYFTRGGASFYFNVTKVWEDKVTDIVKRSSEIHIIALEKRGDKYYLHKDFGKDEDTEKGQQVLSYANNFTKTIHFDPIKDEAGSVRTDIYYAAVEYAITYNGNTQETPFAKLQVGEEVDVKYITNAGEVNTELKTSGEDSSQKIEVYSYAIANSNDTLIAGNPDGVSQAKTITNKINQIATDINVEINWSDSNNIAGYRYDGLKLELYRTAGDTEEKVQGCEVTIPTPTNSTESDFNKYTYKFSGLDMYSDDGIVYTYSVKQYIVNGTSAIYIDETATKDNTKSNYITSDTEQSVIKKDNENGFRCEKTITINNIASKKDYAASFYILWHDEEAYFDDARPDMTYTLYKENEEGAFTKVSNAKYSIKSADGGANPFYQVVVFTGLNQFEDDGDVIKYYVREEIATNDSERYYDYRITHYVTYERIIDGAVTQNPADSSKQYTHKQLISPIECMERYAPDGAVIENSIHDVVNVSGTKRWVNLSATATKPVCKIYLYRESIHDTTNSKESRNAITSTTLNEDKSKYRFSEASINSHLYDGESPLNDYEKYDKYGAAYTYSVDEVIYDANDHIMNANIMAGTAEGNQLLINTFDPVKANRRDITIVKNWSGVSFEASAAYVPTARFYIYRIECDATGIDISDIKNLLGVKYGDYKTYTDKELKTKAELVDTKIIAYKVDATNGEDSVTVGDLSIYAPSGKAYAYFVVEDTDYASSYKVTNDANSTEAMAANVNDTNNNVGYPIAGNVVMVSNKDVLLGQDPKPVTKVTFTNTLKDEKFSKITGVVNWSEGSTAIGSLERPADNSSVNKDENISTSVHKYITLSVKRAATNQEDQNNTKKDNETSNVITIANENITWTQTGPNQWTYVITGEFPIYAENGNPYNYSVIETFNKDSSNKDTSLGVNYRGSGQKKSSVTAALNEAGEMVSKITNYTLKIPAMTNTLKGSYVVAKLWADGNDSYGLRPKKVLVMFQYKGDDGNWKFLTYSDSAGGNKAGKVITAEISRATGWKAILSSFPNQYKTSDGDETEDKFYTYRAVEIGIGYEKTEGNQTSTVWMQTTDISLSDYSSTGLLSLPADLQWDYRRTDAKYGYTEYTDTDNTKKIKSSSTFGSYRVYQADAAECNGNTMYSTVKNVLDQNTYVTVTKTWNDDDNKFGVRPASIKIALQSRVYKPASTEEENAQSTESGEGSRTEWTTVVDNITFKYDAKEFGDSPPANQNVWKKTFKNLPLYNEDGFQYEYRIVEQGSILKDDGTFEKSLLIPETLSAYSAANDNIETKMSYTLVESADKHVKTLPHVAGCYVMTDYKYQIDGQYFITEITNEMQSKESIKIDKDWIIEGGDTTAANEEHKYKSKVCVELKYKDDSTVSQNIILDSADYSYIFAKVPLYNNVGSELESYDVKEVEVDINGTTHIAVSYEDTQGEYQNHKDEKVGYFEAPALPYVDKGWVVQTTSVVNGNCKEYTITNTPLKTHKLEVSYKNDQDNKYSTRPNNVTLKIQYSVDGGSKWNELDDNIKNYILKSQELNPTVASSSDSTEGDATIYEYTFRKLPEYIKIDSEIKKCKYRIIETKADTLGVAYDDEFSTAIQVKQINAGANSDYREDRAVGGYTFAYTNDDIKTTLTKTLLTVNITGKKLWNDQSDKYGTRPVLSGASCSDIEVSVYKHGSATALSDLTTKWSKGADDTWKYDIEQPLPKYASHSQELETYTVNETKVDKQYLASTDSGKAGQNGSAVAAGNASYQIADITNSLITTDFTLQKKWEAEAKCKGFEQVSVTYTLQAKSGDGEYKDYTDKSGSLIRATLNYGNRETSSNITTDAVSVKGIPSKDSAGNDYSYRFIETEAVVKYVNGSKNATVTYSLALSDGTYTVSRKISESDATSIATFSASETIKNLDTDFSYTFGPFKASYEKSGSGSSTVYKYTNSAILASAKVNIKWIEKTANATDDASNDTALVNSFRPESVKLVLQQRIKDSDNCWTTISSDDITKTITKTTDSFDIAAAEAGTTDLQIYVLKEGDIKQYEYRIVESQFGYDTNGNRVLSYAAADEKSDGGDGIKNGFTGSPATLLCNDRQTTEQRMFYIGSQSQGTESNHVFTTNIVNRLQSSTLSTQVSMTLSGTITWRDNANELGKRPNDSGLSMTLKAEPTTGTATTVDFTLGKDGESPTISIYGQNATLTVTKNTTPATGTQTWDYKITGLPRYNEKGNQITYSITQKSNPTDYEGQACIGDPGQVVRDNFAYGTVTDVANRYDSDYKKIEHVDFVENMVTKLIFTKKWIDNGNYYGARPDSIKVFLQSRYVTTDNVSTLEHDFGWQEAFNENLVGDNYITINTSDVKVNEEDVTIDSQTVKAGIWKYEKTLPQYKIEGDNYKLIEYRVSEIGKDEDDKNVMINSESQEVKDSKANSTIPITKATPHIGGTYFLNTYSLNWNKGYSEVEIVNNLDKRSDITVIKKWNTDEPGKSANVKLNGVVNNFLAVLNEDNNWTQTYQDLPKYDANFQLIDWIAVEVEMVDANNNRFEFGETTILNTDERAQVSTDENKSWIATFEEDVHNAGLGNETITFTVTNTPTTSAKLSVSYADDSDNRFDTRFDTTTSTLQYRYEGGTTWSGVETNTELCKYIIAETGSLKQNAVNANGVNATYAYEYKALPHFLLVDNASKKLEYRVVETSQTKGGTKLAVNYSNVDAQDISAVAVAENSTNEEPFKDCSSGGYTYVYSCSTTQADALLTKTLLTTTLNGAKKWTDTSNVYGSRPVLLPTQTDSSVVKVTAEYAYGLGHTLADRQPVVTWEDKNNDTWTYSMSGLPKYLPHTDSGAVYEVTEICTDQQYSVNYIPKAPEASATKAVQNSVATGIGDISYQMTDIENVLDSKKLVAKKVWRKDNSTEEYDITFKLQKRIAGGDWTDVADSYLEKTLTKDLASKQVEWAGLPVKDSLGREIEYQILEITTNPNFTTESDKQVSEDYKTVTFTFYNIETMEYTVEKKWDGIVNESKNQDASGKYSASGILQQHITDDKNDDNTDKWTQVAEWSFSSDYANAIASTVSSDYTKTFTNLPKYTKEGKAITYRGLEQTANGVAIENSPFEVKHELVGDSKTTITNSLKSAELNVIYEDVSNSFDTRFASTTAIPQYRAKDSSDEWTKYTGEADLTITNSTKAATYKYTYSGLPWKIDGVEVEYRILETAQNIDEQNSLAVLYDGALKAVSGGYSYSYSSDRSTLTKTLLLTSLEGNKIWIDDSNSTSTRPDDVTLSVYEQSGATIANAPTFTWTNKTGNIWSYKTSSLPRYNPHTDTVALYKVREENIDQQYGYSGDVASVSEQTTNEYNTVLTMGDIKNTLGALKIKVTKVWQNDNNDTPADDVTFVLYRKVGDSDYTPATELFGDRTIIATDETLTVEWNNLPKKTDDGSDISYEVREANAPAGYNVYSENQATDDGKEIDYTFYNIQSQSFTVKKSWRDVISLAPSDSGNYTASGILQKQVEGEEWTNMESPAYEWSFSNTLAEAQAQDNVFEKSFENLDMYTKDGKTIKYRAVEQKINGHDVSGYTDFTGYTESTDTCTHITNRYNVITLVITKYDEEDETNKLSGVTFGLFEDGNQEPVVSGTTDSNGQVVLYLTKLGNYTLKEISGQTGYHSIYEKEVSFDANDWYTTKYYNISNARKTGTLSITKKDSDTSANLNGVVFELYKKIIGADDIKVFEFTTGTRSNMTDGTEPVNIASGAEVSGIPWGDYYIVEKTPLDGYCLSSAQSDFSVTAQNVDTDKTFALTNVKTKIKFKKESVTGTALSDGQYKITDSLGQEVVTFTVSDAEKEDGHLIEGLVPGEYTITETEAPEGYDIAEPINFYLHSDGTAYKANDEDAYALNLITMVDTPVCSFEVTKKFADDDKWLNSIRPAYVLLQLYQTQDGDANTRIAYGEPARINVNKQTDEYTYTFTNLPMKMNIDGDVKTLTYDVEEIGIENSIYIVTNAGATYTDGAGQEGAGALYEDTITNQAGTPPTTVYVTKSVENGPKRADFNFKIYIGASENACEYLYLENYEVGTYSEQTHTLEGDTETKAVQNDMLTLKDGETLKIEIPGGSSYRVEEILADENMYEVNETRDNVNNHVTITNVKKVYTAITNETENQIDNSDEASTVGKNAGGTIAVISKGTSGDVIDEENNAAIEYKEGKLGVYWKASDYWVSAPVFTVQYTDLTDDGLENKTITVSDFLDENGNIKPVTDPCYDELRARYDSFEITQDAEQGMIVLYLSDTENGMPYLNEVQVEFIPTVAVVNTTSTRAGGQVKIDGGTFRANSDGIGENNDKRYAGKTIAYASADEGHMVDLTKLRIGNVGSISYNPTAQEATPASALLLRAAVRHASSTVLLTGSAEPIILALDAENNFEAKIDYTVADDTNTYSIKGTVEVDTRDNLGNPTSIKLVLDSLTIPVDIGIEFKEITAVTTENQNTNTGNTEIGNTDSGNTNTGNAETGNTETVDTEEVDTEQADAEEVDTEEVDTEEANTETGDTDSDADEDSDNRGENKKAHGTKTGDRNDIYGWILVMIAGLGLFGVTVKQKKNKKI